jgi:radical SAM superfamily enzyme YgiQ (UPF0313 family)
MRLLLVNPANALVSLGKVKENRWNYYRVWKPLGLMVLAGLTPPEWEIAIADENLGVPDYAGMPRPDLVGITAFTSQANRAYELAAEFRRRGLPVVRGGIHATTCSDEAVRHVDSVVTGEAESVWAHVLADLRRGDLKRLYAGEHVDLADVPPARHDLLPSGYAIGAIQTTRGCPLNCSFCSVTSFNGSRYRHRPIQAVVEEFKSIREKRVLIVDDNLIGTRPEHIARAKDLFRALIRAKARKEWICQATINLADDEDLLALAAKAGCRGVFIGFESPTAAGLAEVGKKFNLAKDRDFRASVRRIQRHGILVAGSFIMGLDADEQGIGRRIAEAASLYGLDFLDTLFLTPLPGTRLWDKMASADRILANTFPTDWRYYTLTFPVARYKNLSCNDILTEMATCERAFYSLPRILWRVWGSFWRRRKPLIALLGNLSCRRNFRLARTALLEFGLSYGEPQEGGRTTAPRPQLVAHTQAVVPGAK